MLQIPFREINIRKQYTIHNKLKCYRDFAYRYMKMHAIIQVPRSSRAVLKCWLVKFGGLFNNVASNSALVASSVRMTGKWWIGNDLEGNNCSVFEEFFGDFPGASEFNHRKPQDSRWLGQNTKSHWSLIVFSEWQIKFMLYLIIAFVCVLLFGQ